MPIKPSGVYYRKSLVMRTYHEMKIQDSNICICLVDTQGLFENAGKCYEAGTIAGLRFWISTEQDENLEFVIQPNKVMLSNLY